MAERHHDEKHNPSRHQSGGYDKQQRAALELLRGAMVRPLGRATHGRPPLLALFPVRLHHLADKARYFGPATLAL
jgi:hypothetical protein